MPTLIRSAVLAALVACTLPALAAEPAMDEAARMQYALGYQLGKDLVTVEPRPQDLQRGVEDGRSGAKPKLTEAEMETALTALQQRVNEQRTKTQAADAEKARAAGQAYLAANASKPGVTKTASGLQYRVVTQGSGKKPTTTDTVTVHYKGTLVDGTEFDSSYKRGQPATFPVSGVIPGWTEAPAADADRLEVRTRDSARPRVRLAGSAGQPGAAVRGGVARHDGRHRGRPEVTAGRRSRPMPVAAVNGVQLAYEVHGATDAPAALLVMGLGMPAAMWPDEFVQTLLGRGFRVVTFDNRDSGASTRLADLPVPNIPVAMTRAMLGLRVHAPYTLLDMAIDAAGVLDAAGIERAHVIGVSMGGMIAQVLAALLPQRVLTLTSIMSSSGNPAPRIALGKSRALKALLRPPPTDRTDIDAIVDHLMFVFGVIGSPGYAQDPAVLRPHLERVARLGLYREGTARQLGAILASGDRRPMLHNVDAPTLVIHGASDPLVPVAAGRDTARHVRGATLEIIEGMGHDFPPALMAQVAGRVAEHCASG